MSGKKDIVSKEIEQIEREILKDLFQTELKKSQLINELKTGLGSDVKKIGGKATIIKKNWLQRFLAKVKKLFTTF